MLIFSKKILPLKVQSSVEKAYKAVEVYYKRPGALILSLGVSVVFQLNMVIYYFFIAKALYQNPDPVDFLIKVPVMIFLLMVVPAINGLGVRTGSFRELMKFPTAHAFAVEVIDLGMRIGYGLLGGLVFLFYRRPRGTEKE